MRSPALQSSTLPTELILPIAIKGANRKKVTHDGFWPRFSWLGSLILWSRGPYLFSRCTNLVSWLLSNLRWPDSWACIMSCVEQCTSSVGIPVRLKGFTFCKPVGPRPKFPLSPRTPDDFNQQISIPKLSFENYPKNRGSKFVFLIIPNLAPVPLISSRTTWAPAIKIVKIPNPDIFPANRGHFSGKRGSLSREPDI